MKRKNIALCALAILLAGKSSAETIKAEARCGDPIKPEQVTLLDVSELEPDAATTFVREKVGEVEIVRHEDFQSTLKPSLMLHKIEKKSAEMGCPITIVSKVRKLSAGEARPSAWAGRMFFGAEVAYAKAKLGEKKP